MAIKIPPLSINMSITTSGEKASNDFARYWQEVLFQLTKSINDIISAQETAWAAQLTADGKQDGSGNLDAITALPVNLGLIEQNPVGSFIIREIGTTSTDIPTYGDCSAAFVNKVASSAWTAASGTAVRTGFSTYTGTASASYTQSELQGAMNKIQTLSEHLKALIDDLQANGTI